MREKSFAIFEYPALLTLGVASGFLFFGWNAAKQYLTSFYQASQGKAVGGLNILAILYASGILGNFIGPIFVRRFGLKNSLLFGFLTYTVLVFGVTLKFFPLTSLLTVLMGIGGGAFSIAQIDLLRIVSPKNLRGELTGSINALRTLGGALGLFSVSLLLSKLTINQIYLLLGVIMFIGTLILKKAKFPSESIVPEKIKISSVTKNILFMFKEKRLWLILPVIIASGFLLGLVIGAIPASIANNYGLRFVGVVMPFFHLTLAFSGYFSGKISDKFGRFPILFVSIFVGITAALLSIYSSTLPLIVLSMILIGFFSATNGVVIAAIFIDMFADQVKDAQAASGIIGTLIGIVPAFILNKHFTTVQLFYLGIFLCLLGGLALKILQIKERVVYYRQPHLSP